MSRIRKSDKYVAPREYYVFFGFGSKYSGMYTTIRAENILQAELNAITKYGNTVCCMIENNRERADKKIKMFNVKKLIET